jgi:AP-1 complex subunit beta-1
MQVLVCVVVQVIQSILNCRMLTDLSTTNVQSVCALLTVVAKYSDVSDDATYIVERIVDSVRGPPRELLNILLSSVLSMFVRRPAENQELLGRVLELGAMSDDVDVRDTAIAYYTFLHSDDSKLSFTRCLASLSHEV